MKKFIFPSVLILFCLAMTSLATAEKIYTFDNSAQGWVSNTIAYGNQSYESMTANVGAQWTADHNAGTENGGSVYQTVSTDWENRAYWLGAKNITPEETLGDLTGKVMSTHVRSTGNWESRVENDTVYARWTIAAHDEVTDKWNMWVSKAAYSIDLNNPVFDDNTGNGDWWIYQSIEMVESNFFQWPNYSNGGTFADVLQNYMSFGLTILPTASGNDDIHNFTYKGFGANGELLHYGAKADENSATWRIDDFRAQAVPEPTSLFLFASGICGLSWYTRRKKLN